MKKVFSVALSICMLFGILCFTAFAEEPASADVYVTISNKGSLVLAQEKITVTDIDNDGVLTINDALYCAHEAEFEGGANAGYSAGLTDYGLSMLKLWNDESGNFGYYLNNASAWSLTDTVEDGDYVAAYIYKNADFSDKYCFFDKNTLSGNEGVEVSLTLKYAGYDADWNPIESPFANATITIDGVASEYKTDAEGKVTIKLNKAGNIVISAISDSDTIVPPVCRADVAAKPPVVNTTVIVICGIAVSLATITAVIFVIRRKKENEK